MIAAAASTNKKRVLEQRILYSGKILSPPTYDDTEQQQVDFCGAGPIVANIVFDSTLIPTLKLNIASAVRSHRDPTKTLVDFLTDTVFRSSDEIKEFVHVR
jgi:hypothetical protein